MSQPLSDNAYYTARTEELVREFDRDAERWRPFLASRYGNNLAEAILSESREEYQALIPQLPYIGGDENRLTASLIESARCLALYKAMQKRGRTAAEAGQILYDAVLSRMGEPQTPIPASQWLTPAQLMERRKRGAARSQGRQYAADYVYEFVAGDGEAFDYGYDFAECATLKFYRAQGAAEFAPFFCFLDYPHSRVSGLGLERTMTLAEGHPRCNHRFKSGRKTERTWPPPFLKREG